MCSYLALLLIISLAAAINSQNNPQKFNNVVSLSAPSNLYQNHSRYPLISQTPAEDRKFKILKIIKKLSPSKKKKKAIKFITKKVPKLLKKFKKLIPKQKPFKKKKKKKKGLKKKCVPIILKQAYHEEEDDYEEYDYDDDDDDDDDYGHAVSNQHYNYYYHAPYPVHPMPPVQGYYHNRRTNDKVRKRRTAQRKFSLIPEFVRTLIKASTFPLKTYGVQNYKIMKKPQYITPYIRGKLTPHYHNRVIPVKEVISDVPPLPKFNTLGVIKSSINTPKINDYALKSNLIFDNSNVIAYNKKYVEPQIKNLTIPKYIPEPSIIRNNTWSVPIKKYYYKPMQSYNHSQNYETYEEQKSSKQ